MGSQSGKRCFPASALLLVAACFKMGFPGSQGLTSHQEIAFWWEQYLLTELVSNQQIHNECQLQARDPKMASREKEKGLAFRQGPLSRARSFLCLTYSVLLRTL